LGTKLANGEWFGSKYDGLQFVLPGFIRVVLLPAAVAAQLLFLSYPNVQPRPWFHNRRAPCPAGEILAASCCTVTSLVSIRRRQGD